MGLDLRGDLHSQLKYHIGHTIVCTGYGYTNDPVNIAIECETCGSVLIDADKPEPDDCCDHSDSEDCMVCTVCGQCSESLNDDDVCCDCRL